MGKYIIERSIYFKGLFSKGIRERPVTPRASGRSCENGDVSRFLPDNRRGPIVAKGGVMQRRVLLAASGFALFGVVSIGSTCDLEGDQCQDSLNHCQGNVAIDCYKPGEEVHARERDTTCSGVDDTCFLDPYGHPFCGRGPAPTCPTSEACDGDSIVQCSPTIDGGYAYTDDNCNEFSPGHHCVDELSGYPDAGVSCK